MQVMRPPLLGASPASSALVGQTNKGWRGATFALNALSGGFRAAPTLLDNRPCAPLAGAIRAEFGCFSVVGCQPAGVAVRVAQAPAWPWVSVREGIAGTQAGTTHRAPGERRGCGPTNHHRPCIQGLRRCTRAGAGVGAPGRGQAKPFWSAPASRWPCGDANLRIEAGEIFVIMGLSGSGRRPWCACSTARSSPPVGAS